MSVEKTGLVIQFSLFLKRIEEGKVGLSDVKEIIKFKVDDTDPEKSLENLEQMKYNFEKLTNLFLPYLYEETQRLMTLKRKVKTENQNTTYTIQDLMLKLKIKSRKTIYNYMDDGLLEYIQLRENRRIFTEEQVNNFLQRRKNK